MPPQIYRAKSYRFCYGGICRVNPEVNIRSRASETAAIVETTGNLARDASGVLQQGDRLWADVSVSFARKQLSGWVSSLYRCNG
ncbi:MAG TPA: hypothetical protein V6C57_20205 [Coleofasciculaceae cyanobacterium]